MKSLQLFAFFILSMWSATLVHGAELVVPALRAPVNDYANVVDAVDEAGLNAHLQEFRQTQGPQVAVLTVPSLEGLSIEQFGIKVVDAWKLGDRERDDGLLLLVAPNERKVRIEVGQGLEGLIPDVIAKRIIENVILPEFRRGQMSAGIKAGVSKVLEILADPEKVAELSRKGPLSANSSGRSFLLIAFLVIFMIAVLFGKGGRGRGTGFGPGHSHWGGFGGSSGWGGGGSGGSFGGGGGGFSGGGSSGGW